MNVKIFFPNKILKMRLILPDQLVLEMKKKEVPTNHPENMIPQSSQGHGQRSGAREKGDIKKIETDQYNPNGGPEKRSQKKFDKN